MLPNGGYANRSATQSDAERRTLSQGDPSSFSSSLKMRSATEPVVRPAPAPAARRFNSSAASTPAPPVSFSSRTPIEKTSSPSQATFSLGTSGMKPASPTKGPDPPSPKSPRYSQEELDQQVAAWDNEMDSLDKKHEQLWHDQCRLLRTQIGSLMGSLAELKNEMADLRENVVGKEVERVIENMMTAHDEHHKNNDLTQQRIQYVEDFIGESFEKHAKDLADHGGAHTQHKVDMDTRLEYLESLIGDSADKHAQDIAEIVRSRDEHARNLAETWGAHSEHKVNMDTRLEYLESLIGDNADKHAQEVQAAKALHAEDLHAAVEAINAALSGCVQGEHHNSLETRTSYLETFLGESADKHDRELTENKKMHVDHKVTMETRLEYIEGLLGDGADKHATEIATANGKLADLSQAIQLCATTSGHTEMEQRLEARYSEQRSAVEAAASEHRNANEARVKYLEDFLGESLDKHAKEIADAKTGHTEMEQRLEARYSEQRSAVEAAASEHRNANEARVKYLEDFLGESLEKHAKEIADTKTHHHEHETNVETRLEYIETLIGDSADKHWKEIEAHQKSLGDLHEAVKACSKNEHHTTLEQRVELVEKFAAENARKHEHMSATRVKVFEDKLMAVAALLGPEETSIDNGSSSSSPTKK